MLLEPDASVGKYYTGPVDISRQESTKA